MKRPGITAIAGFMLTMPVSALAQAPFYQGKTLNVVVGYSPGGGYDGYGRLLARHIGRFIPGQPNAVVLNLPGAGSLNAVRQLEATQAKDGTYLTTFNAALISESLLDPDRIRVKFSDLAWIGSMTPEVRVCFMWHATGVQSWDEMAARKEVIFGSTAKGTAAYVNTAILQNLFEIPVRQVLGFPGSAEQRLAIERGELEADCGSWSSVPAEWIRDRKIYPIVTFSPGRIADLPASVPFIGTFVTRPEQKEVLDIFTASSELGRPFVMAGATPKDRVQIIRAAFDAVMKDPQFLADAEKSSLPVGAVSGEQAAGIVERAYRATPEALAKARAVTQ